MPDSVIGHSKIHENKTCFSSSLIALFNIASQFDNQLGQQSNLFDSHLVGLAAGGRQQALVETEGGVQVICTEHRETKLAGSSWDRALACSALGQL